MDEMVLTELRSFLSQYKDIVSVKPDESYRLISISNKGVINLRNIVQGIEIRGDMAYRIKAGSFIYSRLAAHTGSLGLVPPELDGALVTSEMPVFEINQSIILSDYLLYLLQQKKFFNILSQLTKGMGRVRIKEESLLRIQLPIHKDTADQKRVIESLDSRYATVRTLSTTYSEQTRIITSTRQVLLQEATSGKLTAKWRREHPALISGDNHASKLLEEIKSEKERLVKEGEIRRERPLPAITDDEKPLELPKGWVWCRLGEVSNFIDYRGKTPTKTTSGIRLITAKNVKRGSLSLEPEEFISEAEYQQRMTRGFPLNGDLFFTTEAPLGNVCLNVLTEKISVGQRVITIHPFMIDSKLLMYQLLSKTIQSEISSRRSGITAEGIRSSRFKLIPIPVPPIAEQQAIVSRLGELMAMVDELQKQVLERREQCKMLLQAVLTEAFVRS